MENEIDVIVVPEVPKTIADQEVFVYVPNLDDRYYTQEIIDLLLSDKTSFEYVDTALSQLAFAKLDKIATGGSKRVYGVTDDGGQVMYVLSCEPDAGTIAQRDDNGNIQSNAPVASNDVANKEFVLGQIAANKGMQFYEVTYSGGKFRHGDTILNYTALKNKFNDPDWFLYLAHQNLAYIPSIDTNNALAFSVAWTRKERLIIDENEYEEYPQPYISRVIINSDEDIKTEQTGSQALDLMLTDFADYKDFVEDHGEQYARGFFSKYYPNATAVMDYVEATVDELKNNPDIVDIVQNHAALSAYDMSKLGDKDIIRVLQDETQSGASTYYRWNKTTSQWTYIGRAGDYYTKTEADSKFASKEYVNDKLLLITSTETQVGGTDGVFCPNLTSSDITAIYNAYINGKQVRVTTVTDTRRYYDVNIVSDFSCMLFAQDGYTIEYYSFAGGVAIQVHNAILNKDLNDGSAVTGNNYYRHIGTTNDNFKHGVIYFYSNGTFKAIDGSGGGSVEQVQADWNETNVLAKSFIKNKPTIPNEVSVSATGTSTNEVNYITVGSDEYAIGGADIEYWE